MTAITDEANLIKLAQAGDVAAVAGASGATSGAMAGAEGSLLVSGAIAGSVDLLAGAASGPIAGPADFFFGGVSGAMAGSDETAGSGDADLPFFDPFLAFCFVVVVVLVFERDLAAPSATEPKQRLAATSPHINAGNRMFDLLSVVWDSRSATT